MSFKAAAAELCITPSAVSRQVKVLEEQIGVQLFVRSARALALTAAGMDYLRVVTSTFASFAAGTNAVRATLAPAVVRLGLVQTLAANWLVPRLSQFVAHHPAIELQLVTGDELHDVARGEVDLAIRFGQGTWPGVRVDKLIALTTFPVCAPALARGPEALREPRQLERHCWLHLSSYPQAFRVWLTQAGIPDLQAAQNVTFDNADLLFRAAVQKLGIAMATHVLVAPYLESGELIQPFAIEAPVTGAYHLVARGDFARQPAVATVHEWLREIARPWTRPRARG
jgi:LysR family glycine cleavage system transcriptional activator